MNSAGLDPACFEASKSVFLIAQDGGNVLCLSQDDYKYPIQATAALKYPAIRESTEPFSAKSSYVTLLSFPSPIFSQKIPQQVVALHHASRTTPSFRNCPFSATFLNPPCKNTVNCRASPSSGT
ncbi:hypothetical protein AVEN_212028-1 [Araneus ventricosus]|uniref:Uncharacterized protein n=1 Tax=Araneus ventricosus TaxID=182803 RepID=A0A4Y2V6V8_ARAVE|nr:hypothetical protein AVEN_212028-1 [Araneus ventricosus]